MKVLTEKTYWQIISDLDEHINKHKDVPRKDYRKCNIFHTPSDYSTFMNLYKTNPVQGLTFLLFRKLFQYQTTILINNEDKEVVIRCSRHGYKKVYQFFNNRVAQIPE